MSLTKRQKKIILENYDILTAKELEQKTGLAEHEITAYLKLNQKKPLYNSSSVNEKKRQEVLDNSKSVTKEFSFWKIFVENWKFFLVLFSGVVVLYLNGMHGDFVSDDYATIPNNPLLTNFWAAAKLSLTTIFNFIVGSTFGTGSSIPFHVLNLILFLIVLFFGYVFLELLFGSKLSKIAIILFAAHPVNVESISWISGKPYLLIALFLLWALDLFVFFLKSKNNKYLIMSILVLLMTFYVDKPRPLAFPFLAALTIISFKDLWGFKVKFSRFLMWSLGAFVVALIIISPQIAVRISTVNGGYNGNGTIFYNPFFQYPTAIAKYLQILFVPVDMTLYHTMYTFPQFLNWIILLTYLGNVIYFFFKDKRIFFALSFIFVALAPSMAPIKVSWLVAERYAFLGNLGFCLFLAICIEKIQKKFNILALTVLVVLMSFYSARTFLRNIDWQTNHNLWVITCQVSPNSHNAWNNIGDDYDKLKQYDNAIKGFTQSVVVKQDYADAYHNRANIFYKIGRLDLARDSYLTALRYAPGLYQTYFSLIQIDLMQNQLNEALQYALALVKMQPNMPQSHYVLGVVLAQGGNKQDAIKELNTTLALNPQFTPASDLIKALNAQKK